MKPKSFDQWQIDNADMLAEIKANPIPCRNCDGTGECQCDCGDEHDCFVCDGTGELNLDAARALYDQYLTNDQIKMERWARAPIMGK